MVHLGFSSVLMTVLMSNLMLVIIALCFRNKKLLVGIGYKLIAILCIVILLRLLFPLELPVTQTFALPKILSHIVAAFRHPYGTFLGIDLSLCTLFFIVWFLGAVIFGIRLARSHAFIRRYAERNGVDVTREEPYDSILRELCSEKQYRRIRVLKTIGVKGPMITGLRNPLILLPSDAEVSDTDTLYAIKHEIYHYIHHDLWIKFAVKCLAIAYWWNPCAHLLYRKVDALLEMRVDDSIMKKGSTEASKYLLSILHFLTGAKDKSDDDDLSASLCFEKRSTLSRRLCMMQHYGEPKNYFMCIGVLFLIVGIYIGSYLVIFEARDYSGIRETCFTTSKDNVYAIENEDGSYDVYRNNGRFLETVDTLEYYPKDITVYSSEEEYHEKNP